MEEIEETPDGFVMTLAKTTVLYTAATFGMCAGALAAGWMTSNVRTNIKRIKINFETKTDEVEV